MIVKSLKEIEYLAKHQLEIGILAIDKSLMGEDGKTTILNYAIWNEFGTSDIPARPFMRNAFDSNRGIISNLIQVAPKKVIKGEKSGKEALMEIGETIRGLIIQSIATAHAWAVPNDPKTLKIGNQGGTIVFRTAKTNIANYSAESKESINYNGLLLKKVNVSSESLKYKIKFDLIIETTFAKYKTTLSYDLPVGKIEDEGISKIYVEDFDKIIFKRVNS